MKLYSCSPRRAAIAAAAVLLAASACRANTILSDFENFNLDVLYAWANATITSGPTNYQVVFQGFGSGYKALNPQIDASGEKTIELTVTLGAPGASPNQPISGPIVALVDGDGTMATYAWYGQTAGRHVLTASLSSGTGLNTGGTPGLDLSTLSFFHLEDDPGVYHGTYSITFEDLRLIGAPAPLIISESYDDGTQGFTVTWKSLSGRNYTILQTPDLATPFSALVTDITSGGDTTTATVVFPSPNGGFLAIEQQ